MNKQPNSRMCFICGTKNIGGVHVRFYEQADGSLLAHFSGQEIHQGYPGRFHGGVLAGILDETMGRAISVIHGETVWGVTAELSIRYRRPVPLHAELQAVGRVTRESHRMFEGTAEILLADGTVAVEAEGRFVKLPLEALSDFDPVAEEWRVVPD